MAYIDDLYWGQWMNVLQESLTFDDVLLVPKYSEIEHRATVDIGNMLGNIRFEIPIISSPMDTVTEGKMVHRMSVFGGLGIIHRRCTIEKQCSIAEQQNFMSDVGAGPSRHHNGAAIGTTGDYLERAIALLEAKTSVICVDVAHGDHILVKKALATLNALPNRSDFHLMAGNVASGDAFVRLAQWGADSIRVGIGGGSICSTRLNTGFGVPNLSAILDCEMKWKEYANNLHLIDGVHRKKPTLIIDGGIRNAGDIVKALAAGADFVMCGSLLAGTSESPGEVLLDNNGNQVKVYRGMASRESQTDFGGVSSAPEGISTTIPYKGSAIPILNDLIGNIKN